LTFLLESVEEALDDGAADGAELFDLGNVDCFGDVFALIVKPVLSDCQFCYSQSGM
jgi:hypothetical protein